MRYVVVKDNLVVNVIEWDNPDPYNPGPDHLLIKSDTLNIGDDIANPPVYDDEPVQEDTQG